MNQYRKYIDICDKATYRIKELTREIKDYTGERNGLVFFMDKVSKADDGRSFKEVYDSCLGPTGKWTNTSEKKFKKAYSNYYAKMDKLFEGYRIQRETIGKKLQALELNDPKEDELSEEYNNLSLKEEKDRIVFREFDWGPRGYNSNLREIAKCEKKIKEWVDKTEAAGRNLELDYSKLPQILRELSDRLMYRFIGEEMSVKTVVKSVYEDNHHDTIETIKELKTKGYIKSDLKYLDMTDKTIKRNCQLRANTLVLDLNYRSAEYHSGEITGVSNVRFGEKGTLNCRLTTDKGETFTIKTVPVDGLIRTFHYRVIAGR